ncbi:HAD hydrolase family protein [Escherichia coli]
MPAEKNSAYTLKKYDDAMKTVAEMFYHRLEYVDNFDNLEDIFFKFGLNLDELISQVQKALHEAIGDIMVPVHTGNGSIDLIIPGVHKANGLRGLPEIMGNRRQRSGGSWRWRCNDIEMLRQAGFSFAMENAGNAVVAAAKYRAGSNNREGVLDVIDKVLKHEAPFDQ